MPFRISKCKGYPDHIGLHKHSLRNPIQEENRDSPLENLHREKKHLEMQTRISKCKGYIFMDDYSWERNRFSAIQYYLKKIGFWLDYRRTKEHGFSLLELLLVLTIISLLSAIAYPIYTHAIIKTRRIEAKLALIKLANCMEIYYLENKHSYANATLNKLNINEKTEKKFYKLALNSTNYTYTLTATATFPDPECQRFMLNELGEKTNTGNSQCWEN
jgi:type IV pilus assembly protein PilE